MVNTRLPDLIRSRLSVQKEYGLTRFDRHVVRRIAGVLINNGAINMTNLATKSNVQYGRLVKYVEWLNSMGAVQVIRVGRFRQILITEKGRETIVNF